MKIASELKELRLAAAPQARRNNRGFSNFAGVQSRGVAWRQISFSEASCVGGGEGDSVSDRVDTNGAEGGIAERLYERAVGAGQEVARWGSKLAQRRRVFALKILFIIINLIDSAIYIVQIFLTK